MAPSEIVAELMLSLDHRGEHLLEKKEQSVDNKPFWMERHYKNRETYDLLFGNSKNHLKLITLVQEMVEDDRKGKS